MIADFIVSLDGVSAFSPPAWAKDPAGHHLGPYYQRRAARGQERVLLRAHAGAACGNIAPTRDQIIINMRQAADGNFRKDAFLCLFGSSNGAAVALSLAAELQDQITIVYLCLADLPLFDGGRNPPLEGVCLCDAGRPQTYDLVERGLDSRGKPKMITSETIFVKGDRPSTTVLRPIKAGTKENVYQHQGNSIMPYLVRDGWRWTSSMPNGEVHGKIRNADWVNTEIDVSKKQLKWWHAEDGQHHANLDDDALSDFGRRAQQELGKA
jgi:hypothetical protein